MKNEPDIPAWNSPEVTARIQAVEARLAELDPILHGFCARRAYRFSSHVGVWPKRSVFTREEVDRAMYLTTDLDVPELMKRGFHPQMPWSLHASASVGPGANPSTRVLTVEIFRGLPFAQLADILERSLEEGRIKLNQITPQDIAERGALIPFSPPSL